MGGMRKLRWAMDGGGFWELDMETPATMEGTARPVPTLAVPLGVSRGVRLSRTKQLEFMHRFMAAPLVPSYSARDGLALAHAHTLHLHNNWSVSVIEQFQVRKIILALKEAAGLKGFSWFKNVGRKLVDACNIGYGSEFLITPETSLLVETYGDAKKKGNRTKAVLNHKLPQHNLTVEAAWPGLFVDKNGCYWDVPSSVAMDLASNHTDSGSSYHLCLQHNTGEVENHFSDETNNAPSSLQPGLCAKAAFAFRKTISFWRKKEGKVKMVQPYDLFLSEPNISATGIVGSVISASFGDNSMKSSVGDGLQAFRPISLRAQGSNASLMADFFATISFTAQHGNFQRLLFDLSRFNARLEFPSAAAFVEGASRVAPDLYNSRKPDLESVGALCPRVTLALQQQIAGPFTFRVESKLALDPNKQGQFARVDDSIFAIEYAMQVLGSARATAWYSTRNQEAMIELRFFES